LEKKAWRTDEKKLKPVAESHSQPRPVGLAAGSNISEAMTEAALTFAELPNPTSKVAALVLA